jgi:hypothetical protein
MSAFHPDLPSKFEPLRTLGDELEFDAKAPASSRRRHVGQGSSWRQR